ncbi:MAG: hypothetical protein GX345_01055 [Clostridiales bacterium]|nr:hypothetical protein [Clostridiales bacterium]
MLNNEIIESGVRGKVSSVKFEDFIKSEAKPEPMRRIRDFIVLGPFVLETGGALETEYLYERHKVLECDYLASSGGEAGMIPYLGLRVKNDYFGDEELEWSQGQEKWDCLRFDSGDFNACDRALYATEQRNCVYYAATYIDCDRAYDAVLSYETSGSLLYLNGRLIDNKPYGRVKGLLDYGNQVALSLHKGRNLLMFKIRTGYICDTIDLSLSNCALFPLIAKSGNLGLAYPMTTGAFVGSKEEPRQIFPAFVGAFGNSAGGEIDFSAAGYKEKFKIPALSEGSVNYIRFSVPAGGEKEVKADIQVEEKGLAAVGGSYVFETTPYDGFEGTEHIYSDFHFDTTYHQEQRTYALGAIYIMREVLEEVRRNPGFKAIISEVDYVHPYYSLYPHERKTLEEAFSSGRAEADCFYNQPNEMTSSAEGLVRNLIYGQLYHRDVLGGISPVYGPGDVFGHPNQLSQICKKGGCMGIYWGKSILGLDCLFRHMSPDGTELIHARGGTSRKNALRLGLKHCHSSSNLENKVPAYPRDGQSDWMEESLTGARFSVMSDFHKGVEEDNQNHLKETGRHLLERTSRDISLYHAGVSLTRTDLKQANRLAENLLVSAEKFASLSALYGADYPEQALDKAWRQILCGQHHDSITGTNNEISFVDLMIQYREAVELAADVLRASTAFLASGVKTKQGEESFIIFNPHPWERTDCTYLDLKLAESVENYYLLSADGSEYPLQEVHKNTDGSVRVAFNPKVPALGYVSLYLKEKESIKSKDKGQERLIENEFYRIEVDPEKGGGIVSIFDKQAGREVLTRGEDGPANRLVILKQVPDRMETQHEFYTTGHKMFSSDYEAELKSVKGKSFTKLIVSCKMGTVAKIRQEITLHQGVKRIDMKTVVEDYQAQDDLFTLTFPVDIKGGRPVFDDRFAPAVRGESDKKLEFQTHQYAMVSRCQVYAANQWLDLGPTVNIGLDKQGSVNIGMSQIIRPEEDAFISSTELLTKLLAKKAIPVTAYPDKNRQAFATQLVHFNEDLMNTDTRFVLALEGIDNEYENKLLNELDPKLKLKFEEEFDSRGFAVLYTKDCDNLWQKPIDVFLIKAKDEDKLIEIVQGFEDSLSRSHKHELISIVTDQALEEADDYGVALINTGNLACSVEKGGMLNMMLFHTAEFYGNIGKTTGACELVPEQKTHVFTYALYPHQGSFREAGVYKKALEFNDPFLAVRQEEKVQTPFLEESKSFFKANDDFIMTAFKLKGYPLATMQGIKKTAYERGLTIRGFEPHGLDSRAELEFAFELEEALSTDLLDENPNPLKHGKNSLISDIKGHSIETYALKLKDSGRRIGKAKLGIEKEPVQPTYIRSWEHDLGTMPMGYLAFAAFIGRKLKKLDEKSFEVEVSVVNNRPDMKAKGNLELTLPAGWSADKTTIAYDLQAKGYAAFPLTVTKSSPKAQGIIRLNYEDDGQLFEDVFEVGLFEPQMTLKILQDKILVSLANHTSERLTGELALATPIETWGLERLNPFAFSDISPRTQKVDLQAGQSLDYVFEIKDETFDMFKAYYAVAKLMMNGRIYFAYDHKKGPLHNLWAHVFYDEILADGGSIKKLLEM